MQKTSIDDFSALFAWAEQNKRDKDELFEVAQKLDELCCDTGDFDRRTQAAIVYKWSGDTQSYIRLLDEMINEGFPPAFHFRGELLFKEGFREKGEEFLSCALEGGFFVSGCVLNFHKSKVCGFGIRRLWFRICAAYWGIKAINSYQMDYGKTGIKKLHFKSN